MPDRMLECRCFTAPPGRNRWQFERLTEQGLANHWKKTRQRRRLQNSRAKGIRDGHIAGARSAEQPGYAECGVGTQNGWITILIIQPSKKHVHPLQAFECFQVEPIIAHGKIRSLHESKAQIAGEKDVLEVSLVV